MFRRETPCVKKFRKTDMRIMETETENRMKEGKKKSIRNVMGYMAQDYSTVQVSGTVLRFLF